MGKFTKYIKSVLFKKSRYLSYEEVLLARKANLDKRAKEIKKLKNLQCDRDFISSQNYIDQEYFKDIQYFNQKVSLSVSSLYSQIELQTIKEEDESDITDILNLYHFEI